MESGFSLMSFKDAYEDKYGSVGATDVGELDPSVFRAATIVVRTTPAAKRPIIGLSNSDIDHIDESSEIGDLLTAVQTLELDHNHLRALSELNRLAAIAPQLRHLSVAHNPLEEATVPTEPYTVSSNLEELDLSGITWSPKALCRAACAFTQLAELNISGCSIKEFPAVLDGCMCQLKSVDLSNNLIESTADIAPLAYLPAVRRLVLAGNPLKEFLPRQGGQWETLESLNLSGTNLSLHQLRNISSYKLKNLRLSIDSSAALKRFSTTEARAIIVTLTNVPKLNGSGVDRSSRVLAQREFMRQCCLAEDTPDEELAELGLGRTHPDFIEHCDDYPDRFPSHEAALAFREAQGMFPYDVGRTIRVPDHSIRVLLAVATPNDNDERRALYKTILDRNPYLLDRPGSPREHRGVEVIARSSRLMPMMADADMVRKEVRAVFGFKNMRLCRRIEEELCEIPECDVRDLQMGDEEELFVVYVP